ncbi:MAG: hypothetical protein RLZZ76_326 [Candidatus Parcubacteria bacterium]|jgi:hypothetical protein
MKNKILIVAGVLLVIGVALYSTNRPTRVPPSVSMSDTEQSQSSTERTQKSAAPTVEMVTLSGTYVCLPALSGEATADCAFGIKTDAGEYYAVNFGAGAGSMADFRDGARITAKGIIILSKDLNPNSWTKFTSLGLFTVLEKI